MSVSSGLSFRSACLLGFLACAALLGYALYAQYVLHEVPCPLCVFQRIGFIVMGVFFLAASLHAPRRGGRWFYVVGVLLGVAFGIAAACRHLWIQSLPPDQVPECGPGLGYLFSNFPLADVLKKVFSGSGECAQVVRVLGLPMPVWTLAWYVLLSGWVIWAATRRRV